MSALRTVLAALLLLACSLAGAGDAPAPAPPQVLVMLNLPAAHYRGEAASGGTYRQDPGRAARRRIAEDLARSHGLMLVADWPMPRRS